MDNNNLSDDDKRLLAGKCNFMMVTIFSTAAFICGLYSSWYCSFVSREIEFAPEFDLESACAMGLGNGVVCTTLLEKHGIGFYAWEAVVPEDNTVCLSYTQFIPNLGVYVTPDFDTKFNSAKAFAITADVLGGCAWFTLMFAGCCPISQPRLKCLGFYFTLATLFQGLTLLIFKSSVCKVGFFEDYFEEDTILKEAVEDVSCSLDTGSKMAVAATVLYFVCSCMIPGAVAPSPIGYNREQGGDTQEEGAPPPAEKQGATEEQGAPAEKESDTEEGAAADTGEYHA